MKLLRQHSCRKRNSELKRASSASVYMLRFTELWTYYLLLKVKKVSFTGFCLVYVISFTIVVLAALRCYSHSATETISCWFTGVRSVLSDIQDTPERAFTLQISSHLFVLCKWVIGVTHQDLQHLRTEIMALIWSSERNILHCNAFILVHICILQNHPLLMDPRCFM